MMPSTSSSRELMADDVVDVTLAVSRLLLAAVVVLLLVLKALFMLALFRLLRGVISTTVSGAEQRVSEWSH